MGSDRVQLSSVPSLRLLPCHFVILPLPTPEKAATLHGHKAQLIPFSFLADIVKQAEIQPGQPASLLHIFTGSAFWTTIFNLFMTMPFW